MARKYGDEKRQAIKDFREGLINQLEDLYLKAFQQLNELEVGEGSVTQLTTLLLGSRGAAIMAMEEAIEGAQQQAASSD
ncbi:MAG: hercynine metabolism small protein [Prochlorococcus sp.]|nr:hercynine metabolism small protein [Prochlorococcaceae cyanobacterium Fu_MAG_50]